MSLGTILLIVLILILVGVLPTWPHAQQLGIRPEWNRRGCAGGRDRPVLDGAPLNPRRDGGFSLRS